MKLLFLDDSFIKASWHLGYGGFVIDASSLGQLAADVLALKHEFGVPLHAELKWSPPPNHPIRTRLKGARHDLYAAALRILQRHEARLLCAVHSLRDCYGVSEHGWGRAKAVRWAAGQQLRFLAERFARPLLENAGGEGLIICDHYSSRGDEEALAARFASDLMAGTGYEKLDRIPHVALMTSSTHSPAIQLADVVVGSVTSAVAGGKYGCALFPTVAPMLLWDPGIGGALPSYAIIGFGLKVFPASSEPKARELFSAIDKTHLVTSTGWRARPDVREA